MELLVLRVVAFFELLRFDDDFLTFPRNTFRGEKELPRKCLLSPQKMMEVVSVVSVAPPVSVSAAVGAPVPVPAVAVAAAVGVGTLLPGDLLGDLKNTNLHMQKTLLMGKDGISHLLGHLLRHLGALLRRHLVALLARHLLGHLHRDAVALLAGDLNLT